MKVAHVTSALSKQGAGVRSVVLGLAKSQLDQDTDVQVFGLADQEYDSSDKQDWGGIRVNASQQFGPKSIGFAPSLSTAIQVWQPDIVHLHGIWMYPSHAVNQAARKLSCPYIVSVHGMLSEVALSYSPTKKKIAAKLFQDRCFKGAAGLVATSHFEVAEIRAYGIDRPIFTLSNGVETTKTGRPNAPADRVREVVSLGRIHKKKGLDVLIESWAQLEPNFPGWRLRLIGPDESGHRQELRDLAKRLSLTKVSFEEPIYGAERDKALARADIFALPTRSENFALTVAESLMCETPVVSSKGAPWSGLETHGCGRWIDLTVKDFAGALADLMSLKDEQRQAMGTKGRHWVRQEYSWGTIAKKSADIYRSLL